MSYPKGMYMGTDSPNYGKRYLAKGKIHPELRTLRPEQVAWIAGIIEGEGSFIAERRRSGRYATRIYASARIQVQMTDLDVIEKLRTLAGGTINTYVDKRPQCKDQYRWTFRGYENVVLMTDLLRPWMFSRRTGQMDRMLEIVNEVRAGVCQDSPLQS